MEYSILINTCDKFEDCWNPFFKLWSIFWKDCKGHIFLNTEYKDFSYPGLNIKAVKGANIAYSHFCCGMSVKKYLSDVFFRCMLIISVTFLIVYFFHNLMEESFLRLIVTVVSTFLIFTPLFYMVVLNASEKKAAKEILSNLVMHKFLHLREE